MSTEAEIRRRLEPEYVAMFQAEGMSLREARETFNGLFEKAKVASREKGLANMDATRLQNLAETDPGIRKQLDWRAREGVREEDFQWWWNMPDLERQVLLLVDDMGTMAMYGAMRESGLGPEEATQRTKFARVRLAEFLAPDADPADVYCPLPVELKARVVQFFDRQAAKHPEGAQWREMCRRAGSANAAIRKEISEGRL